MSEVHCRRRFRKESRGEERSGSWLNDLNAVKFKEKTLGANMASTASTTAMSNSAAKIATAERTAQVVNSTAQLMRQLRESSHSEVVAQLPKDLLGMVPNIKNTGKLLYQMPAVVLALDSHMDNALNSASHLGKLKELLMTYDEPEPQQAS